MGPSQRGCGEAESVITKVTADYSGRKQTMASRVEEVSYCLQKHIPLCNRKKSSRATVKVRGKIPDLRIDHVQDHKVYDCSAEQRTKTKDYADIQRRASHSVLK